MWLKFKEFLKEDNIAHCTCESFLVLATLSDLTSLSLVENVTISNWALKRSYIFVWYLHR